MHDSIAAVFVTMFIFGAPVIAFIVSRVLRHQERIEMLRRGIMPPPGCGDKRAYREWRKSGAPWPQPGAPWPPPGGTTQGQWTQPAPAPWPQRDDDDPQRALFKGIRIAMVGLALVIGLSFIGGTPGSPDFRGGPWLLGGLIPMFVGIAQILIAVLSGAQLPGVQGSAPAAAELRERAAVHPAPVGRAVAVRGALQAGSTARSALGGRTGQSRRDGSPERSVPFDVA